MDLGPVQHGVGKAVIKGIVIGFIFQPFHSGKEASPSEAPRRCSRWLRPHHRNFGPGSGSAGHRQVPPDCEEHRLCGNTYIKLGLGIPQMLSQPVHGFFLEVHRIDAFKDIIISLGRIVARRLVGAIHAIFIIFLVGLGFFYLTFEFPALCR